MKMKKRLETFKEMCGEDAEYVVGYDFTSRDIGANKLVEHLNDERILGVCELPGKDFSKLDRKTSKTRYILIGLKAGQIQRDKLTRTKALLPGFKAKLREFGLIPAKLRGLGILELEDLNMDEFNPDWLELPALSS